MLCQPYLYSFVTIEKNHRRCNKIFEKVRTLSTIIESNKGVPSKATCWPTRFSYNKSNLSNLPPHVLKNLKQVHEWTYLIVLQLLDSFNLCPLKKTMHSSVVLLISNLSHYYKNMSKYIYLTICFLYVSNFFFFFNLSNNFSNVSYVTMTL